MRKKKPAYASSMSGEDFDALLDQLEISAREFAERLGRTDRTVRMWRDGSKPVPREIAALVNLMIDTETKLEDLKI